MEMKRLLNIISKKKKGKRLKKKEELRDMILEVITIMINTHIKRTTIRTRIMMVDMIIITKEAIKEMEIDKIMATGEKEEIVIRIIDTMSLNTLNNSNLK
jgi:hypothetical protein